MGKHGPVDHIEKRCCVLILNWSRSSKTSDGRGGATGLHWAIGCLAGTRRKEIENEEGNGQNKRT